MKTARPGRSTIKDESRAQLEQMAGFLKAKGDVKVFIAGNTSKRENLELAKRIAAKVLPRP
jgi:outer membrane protein OmpA-like peptidoglycan-associated protein